MGQRLCELFRELQLDNVDALIRCEELINSWSYQTIRINAVSNGNNGNS